jgi:hypothetical protein
MNSDDKKLVKIMFSHDQYAKIVFAAANKGVRWGDYIRSVVSEQAEKEFKEKVKE